MSNQNTADSRLPLPSNTHQTAPSSAVIAHSKPVSSDAVFAAMRSGNVELLKSLLSQHGVDLSKKNGNGDTPLHYSIRHQMQDMFDEIMDCGHDPHIEALNEISSTPLFSSLNNGQHNDYFLEKLLTAGANFEKPHTLWNMTPLYSAAFNRNSTAINKLLQANASLENASLGQRPILELVASNFDVDTLNVLIANKIDIHSPILDQDTGDDYFFKTDVVSLLDFTVFKACNAWYANNSIQFAQVLMKAGCAYETYCIVGALGSRNLLMVETLLSKDPHTSTKIHDEQPLSSVINKNLDYFKYWELNNAATSQEKAMLEANAGNFNLMRFNINFVKESQEKTEFIAELMNIAAEENNFLMMDALRDAKKYSDTQIANDAYDHELNTTGSATYAEINQELSIESQQVLIDNFIPHEFQEILTEKIWTPVNEKDQEIIRTPEDKAFFTALMQKQTSYTELEVVLISKIYWDASQENTLENASSTVNATDFIADADNICTSDPVIRSQDLPLPSSNDVSLIGDAQGI